MKAIPTDSSEYQELVRNVATVFALRIALCFKVSGRAAILAAIDKNNTTNDPACCASHDYCDANVPMHEATCVVLDAYDGEFSVSDDGINTLWGDAWAHAKTWGFANLAKNANPQQVEWSTDLVRTEEEEEEEQRYMDEKTGDSGRFVPTPPEAIPADVVEVLKMVLSVMDSRPMDDRLVWEHLNSAGAIRRVMKEHGINA